MECYSKIVLEIGSNVAGGNIDVWDSVILEGACLSQYLFELSK